MALKLTDQQRTQALLLAEDQYTLAQIAQQIGLNHKQALIDCRKRDPQFEMEFQSARVRSCEAIEDAALDLANMPLEEVKRAEFLLKLYQWVTGVRNPSRYGAKLDVHVTQTLDITAALASSDARLERMVGAIELNPSDSNELW